jgi:transcriptional regulator with XRE-family HTH domain
LGEIKKRDRSAQNQTRPEEWDSPGKRVIWVLNNKFMGNRSTMARRLGFSPSTLSRVVSGEKPPGRRLLTAIVEQLRVDSKWLLTGEGEPLVKSIEFGGLGGVAPVSNRLLPGAPQDHRELLTPDSFDPLMVLGPSQYWYRLTRRDPIVKGSGRGFQSGDLILLETDPNRFPESSSILELLCVITLMVDGQSIQRLAALTYHAGSSEEDPERLEADTFDLGINRPIVKEYVVQETQDRDLRVFRRDMYLHSYRGRQVLTPLDQGDYPVTARHIITYNDIVSYWTGILYRPTSSA